MLIRVVWSGVNVQNTNNNYCNRSKEAHGDVAMKHGRMLRIVSSSFLRPSVALDLNRKRQIAPGTSIHSTQPHNITTNTQPKSTTTKHSHKQKKNEHNHKYTVTTTQTRSQTHSQTDTTTNTQATNTQPQTHNHKHAATSEITQTTQHTSHKHTIRNTQPHNRNHNHTNTQPQTQHTTTTHSHNTRRFRSTVTLLGRRPNQCLARQDLLHRRRHLNSRTFRSVLPTVQLDMGRRPPSGGEGQVDQHPLVRHQGTSQSLRGLECRYRWGHPNTTYLGKTIFRKT